MESGPKRIYPRQQFFAAKAEQAEQRASEYADPSVRESWLSIAKSWRLLAENYADEFNL
jgi:hypothetical protein